MNIYNFSKFFLFLLAITLIACNTVTDEEKDLKRKEKELQLRELEIQEKERNLQNLDNSHSNYSQNNYSNENLVGNKKFIYAVFKVQIPKLEYKNSEVYTNLNGIPETFPETASTIFKESFFITDIIEVDNFNEDEKYKHLDYAEKEINKNLRNLNQQFLLEIFKIRDDQLRNSFNNIKCKIISREILAFDSYSDASISKEQYKN